MKLTQCFSLAVLLAVSVASAQTLSVPQIKVPPGRGNGSGTITFQSGGNAVSGLQFDLRYDTQAFTITPTLSAAAIIAGKTLITSTLGDGSLRILVFGFNQTPIPDGDIVTLSVAATQPPQDRKSKGQASTIDVLGVVGTTPDGTTVPMTSNNGVISR